MFWLHNRNTLSTGGGTWRESTYKKGEENKNQLRSVQEEPEYWKKISDLSICVNSREFQASVMSGHFSGMQAGIEAVAPHAIYIHWHAHRLNLVSGDYIKNLKQMAPFSSILQELYCFYRE